MEKILTKSYWMDEAKSFFTSFLAFFVVDAAMFLDLLWNGEALTWMLVDGLLLAAGRSLIKALLTMLFPKRFPVRSS